MKGMFLGAMLIALAIVPAADAQRYGRGQYFDYGPRFGHTYRVPSFHGYNHGARGFGICYRWDNTWYRSDAYGRCDDGGSPYPPDRSAFSGGWGSQWGQQPRMDCGAARGPGICYRPDKTWYRPNQCGQCDAG